MDLNNNKINNVDIKILKAIEFCSEVKKLAQEYGLSFFLVTEGASTTSNNGCEVVKITRDNHIRWELEHGSNPTEDWREL